MSHKRIKKEDSEAESDEDEYEDAEETAPDGMPQSIDSIISGRQSLVVRRHERNCGASPTRTRTIQPRNTTAAKAYGSLQTPLLFRH